DIARRGRAPSSSLRDNVRTTLARAALRLVGFHAAFAQGIVGAASVPSAALRVLLGVMCFVAVDRVPSRRATPTGWLRSRRWSAGIGPRRTYLAKSLSHSHEGRKVYEAARHLAGPR